MTVYDCLKVDLAYALKRSDHNGLYCNEFSGEIGLYMAFSELRIESFKKLDMLLI